MSTGTKLVQGALARIGAHSPIRPAGPEAIDAAKDVLNSMHAKWQDNTIEFGAVPLDAVGDEFSEPMGLTNTIMDNLAIQLQPLFPNASISADLRLNASRGYTDMVAKFQTITIPKLVGRETLPRGQGSQRRRYSSNIFFNKGEEIG
jgi:hypothetical protein